MKWIAVLSVVVVAGCTTQVDEMSYAQLQQYATSMAEKCQKQGVPDAQLEACAMQEMRADQARRRKQRQFGAALSQASADYGRNMQANRPVNCTSYRSGSMVNTRCY